MDAKDLNPGSHGCEEVPLPTEPSISHFLVKCRKPWHLFYVVVPEFHNSPEWTITKVYVFGNKLTVRAVISSPPHVLRTGTESIRKEICAHFSAAFVVHETTPKVGRDLKGDWWKEFLQQFYFIFFTSVLPWVWGFWSLLEYLPIKHPKENFKNFPTVLVYF